jgi:excinuclease ABC subunit C
MTLWTPEVIEVPDGGAGIDALLDATPARPAVFAVWPREGSPYLARTALLRRRLHRLLRERAHPSRLLNLRSVAARIEYRLTASWLETNLVFHEAARLHFPETYLKLMKLRMPPYVKIILSNPFPRSHVTNRLSGSPALYYGPFRSRNSAEQFESQFLDLFQMRRCQEDLEPSPSHPGCIYGEMSMCLRPCQQVVSADEYRSETERVTEFLSSDGRSLLDTAVHARERLSGELDFEEAARQHKRVEKIQQVLKLRDELARDIARLNGVAVTPSVELECVELWFVLAGCWQHPLRFGFEVADGKTVSMDHRLHEIAESIEPRKLARSERQEHLALLARWFYSSTRDGEWLPFDSLETLPYRRLVNAISRVVHPAEQS